MGNLSILKSVEEIKKEVLASLGAQNGKTKEELTLLHPTISEQDLSVILGFLIGENKIDKVFRGDVILYIKR